MLDIVITRVFQVTRQPNEIFDALRQYFYKPFKNIFNIVRSE